MKVYTTIGLLLFNGIIGVLASNDNNSTAQDLYIFDDNNNPVKLDLSIISNLSNILDPDLPNNVFFNLYTRNNNNISEQLYVDDISKLNDSYFDPRKSTKFVTHGWMSSCRNEVCTAIRKAFLIHGDYNVIEIDWSKIAKKPYLWSSAQTLRIAKYVSRIIDFLMSQGMNPSNVTIVGHSIGAHIAGLSSYYAKEKVYYVVGLDPAGPIYGLLAQGERLSKGDAQYVEVIHTTHLLGLAEDLGDSDFYVNDAILQPGCPLNMGEACSHSLAYKYYAESINNNIFLALRCDNFIDYITGACDANMKAYMGGVTPDFSVCGKFYLTTNPEPPYGKN